MKKIHRKATITAITANSASVLTWISGNNVTKHSPSTRIYQDPLIYLTLTSTKINTEDKMTLPYFYIND